MLVQFVENFRLTALALPGPAGAQDAAVAVGAAPAAAAPPVAREINGLAIVWALIKNWLAGLFGKRS